MVSPDDCPPQVGGKIMFLGAACYRARSGATFPAWGFVATQPLALRHGHPGKPAGGAVTSRNTEREGYE